MQILSSCCFALLAVVPSVHSDNSDPNAWMYRGVRNDSVFTLIVRRIADGIDGTLLVNTKKNGAFCYDSGNFSVITSENSEMFEVDGLMMGVIVYMKKGPNGYAEISITPPENYTGEKEANAIGRYAQYERHESDGAAIESPIMELL